jgi:para-aminobenzoate synthetase
MACPDERSSPERVPADPVRTLVVDDHGSSMYDLLHLIAVANGDEPVVVANDALPWSALRRLAFANVVVSPGPGRPQRDLSIGTGGAIVAASEPEAEVEEIRLKPTPLVRALGGELALDAPPRRRTPPAAIRG